MQHGVPSVSGTSSRAQVHAEQSSNPDCNKRKFGSFAFCRKEKCMIDDYSEVDKLETSLENLKRELN